MDILLYVNDLLEYGLRLRQKIEQITGAGQLAICQEIYRLKDFLLRQRPDIRIGILCISDERDLDRLISIESLFENIFIILVLPCIDDEIIAKGHKLKPRFFSYADSEFDDVADVLHHLSRVAGTNKFFAGQLA